MKLLPLLIAATALGGAGLANASAPAHSPAAAPVAGHRVTTKTATGKTVTYDCAKKGNATKKACRG